MVMLEVAIDRDTETKGQSLDSQVTCKEYVSALKRYEQYLEEYPDCNPILHKKGYILQQLFHYKEAIPIYEHILEADRENSKGTWANLILCLREIGTYDEAIEEGKKAIKYFKIRPSFDGVFLSFVLPLEEAIYSTFKIALVIIRMSLQCISSGTIF